MDDSLEGNTYIFVGLQNGLLELSWLMRVNKPGSLGELIYQPSKQCTKLSRNFASDADTLRAHCAIFLPYKRKIVQQG